MKADLELSLEQRRAKALYESTFNLSFAIAMSLFILLTLFASALLHHFGLDLGGLFAGSIAGLSYFTGNYFALRRVRSAGLSQESKSVETVEKTATQFSGEVIECYFPKVWAFSCLVGIGLLGWGAWWLWGDVVRPHHRAEGILGVFACVLFTPAALILVIFPTIRIDVSGVLGPSSPWWRRRIKWAQITSCEIATLTNFSGERRWREFYFKDESGKVLLHFSSLESLFSSEDKIEAIETDIRRRLIGAEL